MFYRYVLSAVAVLALGLVAVEFIQPQPHTTGLPELVLIQSGPYSYRPAGDFRIGTRIVDAPVQQHIAADDFEIMKYPVSQLEYAACVAQKGCDQASVNGPGNMPQTNINYFDATAYANWYSRLTGMDWQLPTDAEWIRAAGDRYRDDALGKTGKQGDPSERWLAEYRQTVDIRGDADPALRPLGGYGENNLGVADISGNVWEWTETCFQNGKVSDDGLRLIRGFDYCGVRAVQGKHRAFIIEFVRDAKIGGCAAGIPPDYLGFRLVRHSAHG